jgi:PTH1 family peptidyl-tRNA hydrolase
MTYMNLSGQAVAHVARFHRIEPPAILVLVDDMALPVGAIRLRPGGSSGGHNGLESIRQSLGTSDYPRLRIGIGAPMIGEHKIPQSDYVLGTFTDAQMKELAPALDKAADAVDSWLNDGLDSAMNRFNTKVTETPLDNPTQPGSRRPEL